MRWTAIGLVVAGSLAPMADAAAADAQLLVTARVINRCTIDVPAQPPGLGGVEPWRRWVHHACDLPVQPRLTLSRGGGPPEASTARPARGHGHMLVTITY